MTIYLDCNATTPIDPAVADLVMRYLVEEFGNAGSRTHEFGLRAKQAVDNARKQIAASVGASAEEVFFTSGATESNNLAILGLAASASKSKRMHVVSTAIEHKAVLEPLEALVSRGFDVTLIRPNCGGWVDPQDVANALRDDTALVSVMHVNNETGVIQPLEDIASILKDHPALFHTDAAQGFGKDIKPLSNHRIDLISVSSHKVYGPKGVGALVARRRNFKRPPIEPLMYGGGQERSLRPGTVPVPLVAGFGLAAELASKQAAPRLAAAVEFRRQLVEALAPLRPTFNGDQERCIATTLNFALPGVDSEAVMLALKGIAAVSNGSACTSTSYTPSHVLSAMGLSEDRIMGAVRLSWCHLTPHAGLSSIPTALAGLT